MGSMRTIGDAGWIIAAERGYFAEQGLDSQIAQVGGGISFLL
jgi:ABC-type nitrate/sulfonate/bicarbonate transport system substrate-binding protein